MNKFLPTREKKDLSIAHLVILQMYNAKMCLMSYANNKGADQPAHPRSLIRTFVVRCLDRTIPLVVKYEISRLQLAPLTEQAGLNLTWLKIPKDMFSHDVEQMHLRSHSMGPKMWLLVRSCRMSEINLSGRKTS